MTGFRALLGRLALSCAVAVIPSALWGQETPPPAAPVEQAVEDSTSVPDEVSPKGAFIRAALLPGWGHASIGSYTRGAVYFAAEATTAWGILRTRLRLSEVRDRAAFREEVIRSRLEALGTDPEEIETQVEGDEELQGLLELQTAREDEQEDWAALGIFLMFLSGADAFVSAHLQDFPTPITVDAAPLPDGRVELRVSVLLPR